MDSLTQLTLGAAVGELAAGKKAGNKAIYWGMFAGTLPDLDVLFMPFLDPVQQLAFHRGISHSIFFAILISPLLAWLVTKIHPKSEATFKDWTILFFLGTLTHSLLDSLTTYGTQLFLPFSDYRVAINSIFLVDFVYTLPLLFTVIVCLFLHRNSSKRRFWNYLGLGFSTLYLCFGLGMKMYMQPVFKTALAEQNIQYDQFMTAPTPLNTVLWYCVASNDEGNYMGYYSPFDKDKKIHFDYFPKQDELIAGLKQEHAVDRLIWFSKGHYIIREEEGQKRFYDVKFGKVGFEGITSTNAFVFGFQILKNEDGEYTFKEFRRGPETQSDTEMRFEELFQGLWERVMGKEQL